MGWRDKLQIVASKTESKGQEKLEEEVIEHLRNVEKEGRDRHHSYSRIPKLFRRPANTELRNMFRQEAHERHLKKRLDDYMQTQELGLMNDLLVAKASQPFDMSERINYADFMDVKAELPPKFKDYFNPDVFAKFRKDDFGRIHIPAFTSFVAQKAEIREIRLHICLSENAGEGVRDGYLTEPDVECFVQDCIRGFPHLSQLDVNFLQYYLCAATRKFFFFLDHMKIRKVSIKDMLTSPVILEFYDVRENLPQEQRRHNWFSFETAYRVYNEYLQLDVDQNGMLSQSEVLAYSPRLEGQARLTETFVNRLFEEVVTFGGEMDYKTYLDLVLAYENKNTPQSLAYFWKVLDVRKRGFITVWEINYFLRDILRTLRENDVEPPSVEDVKDEIFDMVRPMNPLNITLQDLIHCQVGATVISMLIDVNGFWAYDQRESMMHDDDNEQGHEQEEQ